MKRTQLIEAGILAVALILGYKTFEQIIATIITVLYYPSIFSTGGALSFIIRYVLFIVIYFIGFLLLIKNSWKIAAYISQEADETERINLNINKREILHIILIAGAALTILTNITTIIVYLFDYFRYSASNHSERLDNLTTGKSVADFKSAAVTIVVSFLILYFSDSLTDFLLKRKTTDELVIETPPQNPVD